MQFPDLGIVFKDEFFLNARKADSCFGLWPVPEFFRLDGSKKKHSHLRHWR